MGAAHPLEIPLERFDCLLGQLQRLEFRQLIFKKRNLVGRQFRLGRHPLAFGEQFPPGAIFFLVIRERATGAAEKIEQFELAAVLEQPPRFARSVEIDPVLAEPLERRERGEAAVDGDPGRLVARQAAFQDEQAVLAWRQFQLGEQGIDSTRFAEEKRRLDLAGRCALPDDRLVGPFARQQAERTKQNAFARARLARHCREPGGEFERHLLEQREIADAERLQHGGAEQNRRPRLAQRSKLIYPRITGQRASRTAQRGDCIRDHAHHPAAIVMIQQASTPTVNALSKPGTGSALQATSRSIMVATKAIESDPPSTADSPHPNAIAPSSNPLRRHSARRPGAGRAPMIWAVNPASSM